jgi:plasmid stability protein
MKSIKIHNLDDDLYFKIRSNAKKNHRSMNQEIKDKLVNIFLDDSANESILSFKKYLGIWNETDFEQFKRNTSDFEKINESDFDKL